MAMSWLFYFINKGLMGYSMGERKRKAKKENSETKQI